MRNHRAARQWASPLEVVARAGAPLQCQNQCGLIAHIMEELRRDIYFIRSNRTGESRPDAASASGVTAELHRTVRSAGFTGGLFVL